MKTESNELYVSKMKETWSYILFSSTKVTRYIQEGITYNKIYAYTLHVIKFILNLGSVKNSLMFWIDLWLISSKIKSEKLYHYNTFGKSIENLRYPLYNLYSLYSFQNSFHHTDMKFRMIVLYFCTFFMYE